MWLRDALDFLCHQKLRELTDFEWQQFLRLYIQEDPGKTFHEMYINKQLTALLGIVYNFCSYLLKLLKLAHRLD